MQHSLVSCCQCKPVITRTWTKLLSDACRRRLKLQHGTDEEQPRSITYHQDATSWVPTPNRAFVLQLASSDQSKGNNERSSVTVQAEA